MSFNLLNNEFLNDFSNINLKSIFSFFELKKQFFLGSDFLHLLKNFRSKVLTDLVIVNPDSVFPPINSLEIENVLKLGAA